MELLYDMIEVYRWRVPSLYLRARYKNLENHGKVYTDTFDTLVPSIPLLQVTWESWKCDPLERKVRLTGELAPTVSTICVRFVADCIGTPLIINAMSSEFVLRLSQGRCHLIFIAVNDFRGRVRRLSEIMVSSECTVVRIGWSCQLYTRNRIRSCQRICCGPRMRWKL